MSELETVRGKLVLVGRRLAGGCTLWLVLGGGSRGERDADHGVVGVVEGKGQVPGVEGAAAAVAATATRARDEGAAEEAVSDDTLEGNPRSHEPP